MKKILSQNGKFYNVCYNYKYKNLGGTQNDETFNKRI